MPDIYPTGLSQDHTFLLCLSVCGQYADTEPLGGALGTYQDRWPKVAESGPGTSPDCSERWQGVLRWQQGIHWKGPLPAQSITAVRADSCVQSALWSVSLRNGWRLAGAMQQGVEKSKKGYR